MLPHDLSRLIHITHLIEKSLVFKYVYRLKMLCFTQNIFLGGFDEIREECCWFQDLRSGICLIYTLTSKRPVRCTKHQDLVGEKDERGKDLSANAHSRISHFSTSTGTYERVNVNCLSLLP